MDWAEANTVLNEITKALKENSPEETLIEIQTLKLNDYSICIKSFLSTTRKQLVTAIAQKHGLKVSEEPKGIVLS